MILETEKIEVEEESSVFSKIMVAKNNLDWIKEDLIVAIINVDETEFLNNLSNVDICGKNLANWIKFAMTNLDCEIIKDESDLEIIQTLKTIAKNKKYIFLAYSTLPYLKKNTVLEAVSYFDEQHLNVMQLPKGMIIKTDYLDRLEGLYSSVKKSFGEEDFEEIKTSNDISKFYKIMSKKIIEYHKGNGVIFIGEESIYIDADVEIESGVIIYQNNTIKGQSSIGKNVVLKSGNIVIDSIVEDGAKLVGSFIQNSRICCEKVVGPCEKIINESV